MDCDEYEDPIVTCLPGANDMNIASPLDRLVENDGEETGSNHFPSFAE